MAQAIEDGYLAACLIQKGRVSIDDTTLTAAEVSAHNPTDPNSGATVLAEKLKPAYGARDYDNELIIAGRVPAMCADLFNYLCESGGPEQKTIVFCTRDHHADLVADEMNNLYADWCVKNSSPRLEPYAFKCTAAASGNDQLPDLRGASRHHFVATTVDLLTTGVDVPCVRNIVFFKYVKSSIAFYQMVGRGTRLDAPTGKLMFTVYDYTNATRLFGEDFLARPQKPQEHRPPGEPKPVIRVEGFEVHVTEAGRYILADVDGKALPITVEEYKERMAARLVAEMPTLDGFRQCWIEPEKRRELIDTLVTTGYSPTVVRVVEEMNDYDLYDVLAELGYGLAPRTRAGRADAFNYKHAQWLARLPIPTATTLKALAAQFARTGTEGLENPQIFQTPAVMQAGGLEALKTLGQPAEILHETKERLFAA
jgi:type I restriction enzyme R subunit